MTAYSIDKELKCFHCGDVGLDKVIEFDEKQFCCEGCRSVYKILKENHLSDFYKIDSQEGAKKVPNKFIEEYTFLDNKEIASHLLDFESENLCKVTFKAPSIHCSSCIWLLENLPKVNNGILSSEVNFVEKEIYINYDPVKLDFKQVVFLLAKIGYEPEITLGDLGKRPKNKPSNRSLWYKLGVSGFAFGNIMLFSLPAYFGLDIDASEKDFDLLFKIINVFLSIPVLFYAASEFLKSAFSAIRNFRINIDVPLCIGILALYFTSMFEIISGTGAGYLDSFSALIFFLLTGRAIQRLSFEKLKFERDNLSYFPLSAIKVIDGEEEYVPVTDLKIGDTILVRSNEIIPADGILKFGNGYLDYSFVTGEANPVSRHLGSQLYAGGRQVGGCIEIELTKLPSQSYLTQLWDKQGGHKDAIEDYESVVNKRSKYFTYLVLAISLCTFIYWTIEVNWVKGLIVMATTLNVSCPCALAVAIPFTYANIIKHLSLKGFYLKNAQVVEKISKIDTVVFDKTGTITEPHTSQIYYDGVELSERDLSIILSGVRQSTHPLSAQLFRFLNLKHNKTDVEVLEVVGKGLQLKCYDKDIKIGSAAFLGVKECGDMTSIHVMVSGIYKGRFVFQNKYLEGLHDLVGELEMEGVQMALLSGDNDSERGRLENIFPNGTKMLFNQKPDDKQSYVDVLKKSGCEVLMVGDGLNDTGALNQSQVGVAVVNEHSRFSPSSDVIMKVEVLTDLNRFMKFCKSGISVIKFSFLFSSLYNAIGLCFAVQGLFSPVFAAILMPISSISVVLFSFILTNLNAKKILNT